MRNDLALPLFRRLIFGMTVACFSTSMALAETPTTTAQGQSSQASDFLLKDGNRVTFYGDSITEQREYTEDVEAYVLTRFPGLNVDFHNGGVGGDKVSGGHAGPIDLRLKRDVLDFHPDVITVMLGMNDGYYRADDPGIYKTYTDGMRHIVDTLQQELPNADITLIQPSPHDDETRTPDFANGGYNAVLLKYGEFVRGMSHDKKTRLVDFNAPVTALLRTLKEHNPDLAQQVIPDRVHPQQGGHWLMAAALLKEWKAPAMVSSVSLNAHTVRLETAMNTTVSDLRRTASAIQWTQRDSALPLPLPPAELNPVVGLMTKYSDLLLNLDQQILQVAGLGAGRYELRIDDRPIEAFSTEELAQGVNLATRNTPMLEQALLVAYDTERKNDLEGAWFQLTSSGTEESPAVAAALKSSLPVAVKRQHQDAQPRAHRFELVAVKPTNK